MSRALAGMATAIGPSHIGLRGGQAPRSAVPKLRRRMSAWAGAAIGRVSGEPAHH